MDSQHLREQLRFCREATERTLTQPGRVAHLAHELCHAPGIATDTSVRAIVRRQ